ncbi:alpha-xenorhabdolysin family binary toxin subunit A [Pseudomonas arcuscaelestis]|uniref:alpha-xenorhabdolysin family binary toxin subunit A n=1 Tax=Pseudomonas arcuscaelestis TaxID=2710591 RepID=UPI00193EB30D|nr:alpha-xenorhabdolysin family binary toxin subunit A [Pseudomonas arcuscaelestis]MBM3110211.1 alpha-xenorhabdolysin family binary toxin subunit A [Pseudomonas arcuscaelestis]
MDIATDSSNENQDLAQRLPGNLIQGMEGRDGPDNGGLVLTREHIETLSQYANHVFSLPSTSDTVIDWLGYDTISESGLMPDSMLDLNLKLQEHGRSWIDLSDVSKKLGAQLASTANSINSGGQFILNFIDKRIDAGHSKDKWESIEFHEGVKLSPSDQIKVETLVEFMEILRKDVTKFAESVGKVQAQTKNFRDVALLTLAPLVMQKIQAVQRRQSSDEVEHLRNELDALDKEIVRLGNEYDQYVKAAIAGVAAGPLGAVITGSIYGSKAEKVRKERNKRQSDRGEISDRLKAEIRLEGLLEQLHTQMGQLEARLGDVMTSSEHLHTAWGLIGSYIDTSIDILKRIETDQQLFAFSFNFEGFIGQWGSIEVHAVRMNTVFADAISKK